MKTEMIDITLFTSRLIHDFYAESLRYVCDLNGPAMYVAGDREYLNMLMHNVIQNAERHGRGDVLVRLVERDDHVSFVVEDNGVGNPINERRNFLKTFYRVASARYTSGHGIGVGLIRINEGIKNANRFSD